jgi:hypothetical protein
MRAQRGATLLQAAVVLAALGLIFVGMFLARTLLWAAP